MSFAPLQFNNAKTTGNPLVVAAFLCSSFKTFLEKNNHSLLAKNIKGVKVTTNSITILTGKPLINAELRLHREDFLKVIQEVSSYLHQDALVHKKVLFH